MNYFLLYYCVTMDGEQTYCGRAMKATNSNILFECDIIPFIEAEFHNIYPHNKDYSVSILKIKEITLKEYDDFHRANDKQSRAANGFLMEVDRRICW